MTIVKCQTQKGQIQGPLITRIIVNANKQRSENILNETGQDKMPPISPSIEDTDHLANRRPISVAYAPLWGKLALAPESFEP